MASTPNFNWSTPDNTGLVKNGALDIRTLGNAIDASMVDLKGGTTGQVLSKASNTDMDFTWATDASGIPATILDAKGDIIAATAADTASRLAVGTNGQVLTADSTAATGLKWAAASAGALTKVMSATFSSVANTGTTFDGVFTSTYNNYVIVFSNLFASGNVNLLFQLRKAGPTTQASAYYGTRLSGNTLATTTNGTSFDLFPCSTESSSGQMLLATDATPTTFSYTCFGRQLNQAIIGGCMNDSVGANAATGFILSPSSGTISGFVAVYGLAD